MGSWEQRGLRVGCVTISNPGLILTRRRNSRWWGAKGILYQFLLRSNYMGKRSPHGNNMSQERGKRSLKTHGQVQQDVRGDLRRDECPGEQAENIILQIPRPPYKGRRVLVAATEADWVRGTIHEPRCRLFPVRRRLRRNVERRRVP